jgi:hypothetical protein
LPHRSDVFVWRYRPYGLASGSRQQSGGYPMGLTLKLDVLAMIAAFGFLGAIVFGAF